MKSMKILFILSLSSLGFSCQYGDNRLLLKNDSPHLISVAIASPNGRIIQNSIQFYLRDTIGLGITKSFSEPSNSQRNGWSIIIEESKEKKLNLFVFKFDTLYKYKNQYKINQLVKENLFDTLLSYSESELDSMNWVISYKGKY